MLGSRLCSCRLVIKSTTSVWIFVLWQITSNSFRKSSRLFLRLTTHQSVVHLFIRTSLFVKRYATFSATTGICRQMIDGLGPEASLKMIGAEMIKVVDDSLTNYWDPNFNEKIPDKLRAMAAVYAQVHEINYGNWTQGKKALSKIRENVVNSWRALFRRLKQLNQQKISMVWRLNSSCSLYRHINRDYVLQLRVFSMSHKTFMQWYFLLIIINKGFALSLWIIF